MSLLPLNGTVGQFEKQVGGFVYLWSERYVYGASSLFCFELLVIYSPSPKNDSDLLPNKMPPYPRTIPPDEDRGPQLLAMYWTECTVVTIVVALRFYSRIRIKGLGLDDWNVLFTMVRANRFSWLIKGMD